MDDGSFSLRSKGLQERTTGGSGRIEICVEAMSDGTRVRLRDYLRDTHGLDVRLRSAGSAGKAVLVFSTAATAKFQEMVAPYMAPSMEYKLLPRFRGRSQVTPQFVIPTQRLVPARVLDVHVKPHTRSMNRFDIEVEGNHNYFVDGVMVHNSPETTTGGKALKFYASIRLDVRRIETLKDGTDAVGNRTRVKVVKNKVSPPFKQAEFDILYGKGISREGSLIDMGVDQGFIRKSGSWFTYEGEQLGQGKENARTFLMENTDVANEIEKKIKEKLGIGAVVTDDLTDDSVLPAPVDFCAIARRAGAGAVPAPAHREGPHPRRAGRSAGQARISRRRQHPGAGPVGRCRAGGRRRLRRTVGALAAGERGKRQARVGR